MGAPNLTLGWSPVHDLPVPVASGVDHYRVRIVAGAAQLPAENVTTPQYLLRLADGGHYRIFVAAIDRAGNLGTESSVEFAADLTGPTVPTNLRVEISQGDAPRYTLRWDPSIDAGSGVAYYLVSVGTFAGGSDVVDDSRRTEPSYNWTGVYGQTYYVRLKAVDAVGNEGSMGELVPPARAELSRNDLSGVLFAAVVLVGTAVTLAALLVRRRHRSD